MNTKQPAKFKKTLLRILKIGWIAAVGLALTGAPLAPGPVQAQSIQMISSGEQAGEPSPAALAPVLWRDEFNGSLDAAWSWMNENSSTWNLTENAGFLRIYASHLGLGGENLLLRPVAAGDFAIETRQLFQPTVNFQIASLVIYQDAENFLQFGRAFCDVPDACVGNGIYFDRVEDTNFMGNFATAVNNDAEAYLRLERRGDQVRGLFSYEGVTWFEIGTHSLPAGFQVNGVGLSASQDFTTSDADIPADFDYFELTEGGGFLPEGSHDGNAGIVPNYNCSASGWAVDPDDRTTDLWVELVVDDVSLPPWLQAGDYRQDLDDLGLCTAGTCGFSTDLWGQITSYQNHTVAAYAQDIPSGDWVLLNASPKDLSCNTHDIYIYDTLTDAITQTTSLVDSGEYAPKWSPDGQKIVHNVWDINTNTDGLYITDVASGVSTPLSGAASGSSPAWSPDGQWIAFMHDPGPGDNVYVLPPAGGTPTLVRADAAFPAWSPDGLRLVVNQPSDGSIRTMDASGSNVIKVVASGDHPAWSPDGQWISYDDDGNLFKVRVDLQGNPLGNPIQLTDETAWEGRTSWSADSQTIVFHGGFDMDTDLYTIPAWGGLASWLVGVLDSPEYDPSYSFDGRYIAYAGLSPAGQAPRYWVSAYTAGLPRGLADGSYPYHFEAQWTQPMTGTFTGQAGDFVISDQAPLYEGDVLLRGPYELAGVDSPNGLECVQISEINPDQPARFLFGWLTESEMTYPQALAHFNSLTGRVLWGSSGSASLARHEILPFSLNDTGRWYNYVCSYTRKEDTRQLFLPVMSNP